MMKNWQIITLATEKRKQAFGNSASFYKSPGLA